MIVKLLRFSEKLFIHKNFAFQVNILWFPWLTLMFSHKTVAIDQKCSVLLGNFVCSQNIFVSQINFVFVCKTIAFAHKTFVFFWETSAFNTLQFAHTTFVMDIKLVGSKNYISVIFKILRKVFWGKQKALWENAKALKFFLQSPFHLGSIFEITVLLFCFLLNLLIC